MSDKFSSENPDKDLGPEFYIEFSLEGVVKAGGKNKDLIIKDLEKIFSKILNRNDILRVVSNINVLSDEGLIFPIFEDVDPDIVN